MNLNSRHITLSLLLLMSPLSANAATASENCQASEHTWVPAKYYLRESIVFYEDQWYQARQTHEGREPGPGEFAWQALKNTPACAASEKATSTTNTDSNTDAAEPEAAATTSTATNTSNPSPDYVNCPQAEDWSFAAVYTIGDYARHEGQVYRAIRPTNGTLPGTGRPPQWQPMEDACTQQN